MPTPKTPFNSPAINALLPNQAVFDVAPPIDPGLAQRASIHTLEREADSLTLRSIKTAVEDARAMPPSAARTATLNAFINPLQDLLERVIESDSHFIHTGGQVYGPLTRSIVSTIKTLEQPRLPVNAVPLHF